MRLPSNPYLPSDLPGLVRQLNAVYQNIVRAVHPLYDTVEALVVQAITNGDTTHAPSADAVFDALAGKQATIADSGWIAPTLLNSWVNFGGGYSTVGYRKVGSLVTIRGLVKGGVTTDGTEIFTLPAGFRPPATV